MDDNNEDELFPTLVAPPEPVVNETTGEENPNFIYSDSEDENVIPDIIKKDKIEHTDMFIDTKKKRIKKVIEPDDDDDEPPIVEPVKPVKKKRIMTDEHKQKLAFAREKALESRRRNASIKKQEADLIKQEKELSNQLRHKRIIKMKHIVNSDEEPSILVPRNRRRRFVEPEPEPEPVVVEKIIEKSGGFTQEQMDMAIIKALEINESKRKQRKEIKKKIQTEEEQKAKIFNTINRAVSGNPQLDQWSHCFN